MNRTRTVVLCACLSSANAAAQTEMFQVAKGTTRDCGAFEKRGKEGKSEETAESRRCVLIVKAFRASLLRSPTPRELQSWMAKPAGDASVAGETAVTTALRDLLKTNAGARRALVRRAAFLAARGPIALSAPALAELEKRVLQDPASEPTKTLRVVVQVARTAFEKVFAKDIDCQAVETIRKRPAAALVGDAVQIALAAPPAEWGDSAAIERRITAAKGDLAKKRAVSVVVAYCAAEKVLFDVFSADAKASPEFRKLLRSRRTLNWAVKRWFAGSSSVDALKAAVIRERNKFLKETNIIAMRDTIERGQVQRALAFAFSHQLSKYPGLRAFLFDEKKPVYQDALARLREGVKGGGAHGLASYLKDRPIQAKYLNSKLGRGGSIQGFGINDEIKRGLAEQAACVEKEADAIIRGQDVVDKQGKVVVVADFKVRFEKFKETVVQRMRKSAAAGTEAGHKTLRGYLDAQIPAGKVALHNRAGRHAATLFATCGKVLFERPSAVFKQFVKAADARYDALAKDARAKLEAELANLGRCQSIAKYGIDFQTGNWRQWLESKLTNFRRDSDRPPLSSKDLDAKGGVIIDCRTIAVAPASSCVKGWLRFVRPDCNYEKEWTNRKCGEYSTITHATARATQALRRECAVTNRGVRESNEERAVFNACKNLPKDKLAWRDCLALMSAVQLLNGKRDIDNPEQWQLLLFHDFWSYWLGDLSRQGKTPTVPRLVAAWLSFFSDQSGSVIREFRTARRDIADRESKDKSYNAAWYWESPFAAQGRVPANADAYQDWKKKYNAATFKKWMLQYFDTFTDIPKIFMSNEGQFVDKRKLLAKHLLQQNFPGSRITEKMEQILAEGMKTGGYWLTIFKLGRWRENIEKELSVQFNEEIKTCADIRDVVLDEDRPFLNAAIRAFWKVYDTDKENRRDQLKDSSDGYMYIGRDNRYVLELSKNKEALAARDPMLQHLLKSCDTAEVVGRELSALFSVEAGWYDGIADKNGDIFQKAKEIFNGVQGDRAKFQGKIRERANLAALKEIVEARLDTFYRATVKRLLDEVLQIEIGQYPGARNLIIDPDGVVGKKALEAIKRRVNGGGPDGLRRHLASDGVKEAYLKPFRSKIDELVAAETRCLSREVATRMNTIETGFSKIPFGPDTESQLNAKKASTPGEVTKWFPEAFENCKANIVRKGGVAFAALSDLAMARLNQIVDKTKARITTEADDAKWCAQKARRAVEVYNDQEVTARVNAADSISKGGSTSTPANNCGALKEQMASGVCRSAPGEEGCGDRWSKCGASGKDVMSAAAGNFGAACENAHAAVVNAEAQAATARAKEIERQTAEEKRKAEQAKLAKEESRPWWEKLWSSVVTAVQNLGASINRLAQEAGDAMNKAGQAWNDAVAVVQAKGKEAADSVGQGLQAAGNAVGTTLIQAGTVIANAPTALGEVIKKGGETIGNWLNSEIAKFWANPLVGNFLTMLKDLMNKGFDTYIAPLLDWLRNNKQIIDMARAIVGELLNLAEKAPGRVGSAFASMNAIFKTGGKFVDEFGKIVNEISAWISNSISLCPDPAAKFAANDKDPAVVALLDFLSDKVLLLFDDVIRTLHNTLIGVLISRAADLVVVPGLATFVSTAIAAAVGAVTAGIGALLGPASYPLLQQGGSYLIDWLISFAEKEIGKFVYDGFKFGAVQIPGTKTLVRDFVVKPILSGAVHLLQAPLKKACDLLATVVDIDKVKTTLAKIDAITAPASFKIEGIGFKLLWDNVTDYVSRGGPALQGGIKTIQDLAGKVGITLPDDLVRIASQAVDEMARRLGSELKLCGEKSNLATLFNEGNIQKLTTAVLGCLTTGAANALQETAIVVAVSALAGGAKDGVKQLSDAISSAETALSNFSGAATQLIPADLKKIVTSASVTSAAKFGEFVIQLCVPIQRAEKQDLAGFITALANCIGAVAKISLALGGVDLLAGLATEGAAKLKEGIAGLNLPTFGLGDLVAKLKDLVGGATASAAKSFGGLLRTNCVAKAFTDIAQADKFITELLACVPTQAQTALADGALLGLAKSAVEELKNAAKLGLGPLKGAIQGLVGSLENALAVPGLGIKIPGFIVEIVGGASGNFAIEFAGLLEIGIGKWGTWPSGKKFDQFAKDVVDWLGNAAKAAGTKVVLNLMLDFGKGIDLAGILKGIESFVGAVGLSIPQVVLDFGQRVAEIPVEERGEIAQKFVDEVKAKCASIEWKDGSIDAHLGAVGKCLATQGNAWAEDALVGLLRALYRMGIRETGKDIKAGKDKLNSLIDRFGGTYPDLNRLKEVVSVAGDVGKAEFVARTLPCADKLAKPIVDTIDDLATCAVENGKEALEIAALNAARTAIREALLLIGSKFTEGKTKLGGLLGAAPWKGLPAVTELNGILGGAAEAGAATFVDKSRDCPDRLQRNMAETADDVVDCVVIAGKEAFDGATIARGAVELLAKATIGTWGDFVKQLDAALSLPVFTGGGLKLPDFLTKLGGFLKTHGDLVWGEFGKSLASGLRGRCVAVTAGKTDVGQIARAVVECLGSVAVDTAVMAAIRVIYLKAKDGSLPKVQAALRAIVGTLNLKVPDAVFGLSGATLASFAAKVETGCFGAPAKGTAAQQSGAKSVDDLLKCLGASVR